MPHGLIFTVFVVAAIGIIAGGLLKPSRRKSRGVPKAKRLLTDREQAMYHRLKAVWSSGHVLTQVAMGAMLSARDQATRNSYDRKIVDFVLVDPAFDVVAIIELDDSSHARKGQSDKARDEMLQSAGYHTLRYANVPDLAKLALDLGVAVDPKNF